jgi:trehalose 6-phosphate synthase/phosphatase
MSDDWKPRVRPVLDLFVDRTPGSFIEEKHYSMAWHYRAIHPSHGQARAAEMKESLAALARDLDLTVLEGNRVLEIKSARVNKGTAAHRWMCREDDDFVLAIGDDRTDEDMFEMAPERAWTIKVGTGPTHASFSVREVADVQDLLNRLVEADTQ